MTNRDFRTLAYSKSPKTSKRTTFQDELEASVSAWANKQKTEQYSYSEDFNDDEDDFLNKLLKSRKKKADAHKTEGSKANVNDFDLSEDEDTPARAKKVSFLKTKRNSSPLEDTTASEHYENEPPHSSTQPSTHANEDDLPHKQPDDESTNPQIARESSSKSPPYQTSEDTPLPLPSETSVFETPDPVVSDHNEERNQTPELSEGDLKPAASTAESVTEPEPPRPKPRQRTVGLSLHTTEKQADSQDLSRPQTSPTSIPPSSDALDEEDATRSCSTPCIEGEHADLRSLSKSSSGKSEQSQILTKSTFGSESRDGFVSDDNTNEGKRTISCQDLNENSGDHLNHSNAQLSRTFDKSHQIRTSRSPSKTTQRPPNVRFSNVEPRYLGSLKILDVSLQDSQPHEPNTLRAAVYQEWLQRKKEKSKEIMQLKKKEEIVKENKKREQDTKKEEAMASYEAWKELKVERLKAKAKEKQDKMRKEQRAIEEKEEKKESAKKVFEKWKHEHDLLLKEKNRKEREAENKQNLQKQEEEEERKRSSKSAFSNWCEKKDVLRTKATVQRKELKTKAEEEQYMREEKDQMALDMYESWLVKKDLEKKRQREERYIQAILQHSPPPPWSPPNKTVPQGK